MKEISLAQNGEEKGPYSLAQVKAMYFGGAITSDTFYWFEGMSQWQPISELFSSEQESEAIPVPRIAAYQSSIPNRVAETMQNVNQRTDTSGAAICSLIFGLIGVFPLAIIMGHVAKKSIKDSTSLTGSGLAVAGLVLGYVELSVFLVIVVTISILFELGREPTGTFEPISSQLSNTSQ